MAFLLLTLISLLSTSVADTCQGLNCGPNPCCPGPKGTDNALCCTQDEACCPDPVKGGVCCIEASSFCCAPDGINPSRCCPRWMVCCKEGNYGCCTPGAEDKVSQTAYALFDEANFDGSSNLYGFTIDTGSASKSQVIIDAFDDYGEQPRVFVFNANANLFYLLRANFTDPGFNGTAPIYLTTADPVKGTSSQILVNGAAGLVTGYDYVKQLNSIIFATYIWKNNQKVGYNFYVLDIKSGNAKQISSSMFGSQDNWVGWFHANSPDGRLLYRLGYKDVVNSVDPGLGLTDISKPTATTTWIDNFTVPDGFEYYSTIDVVGDSFFSLANDGGGNLNLIQWSPSVKPKILAYFDDAHLPRFFGPIATCLDQQQQNYYALVVHDGLIPIQTDRWALASYNIQSATATSTPIWPWMLAGTDSAAGFGIAQ